MSAQAIILTMDELNELIDKRVAEKAAQLRDPLPAPINLTQAQERYGRPYQWFAGRAGKSEGMLNHYRKELEEQGIVQFPREGVKGYLMNKRRMDPWMDEHGTEVW